MSGVIDFSITFIYCNLSNWIAGKIYWLTTTTHHFRTGSYSARGIESIIFFKKIWVFGVHG